MDISSLMQEPNNREIVNLEQNIVLKTSINNSTKNKILIMEGTIIKEGVFNDIFYSWKELKETYQWNYLPVTLGHPKDSEGNPTSYYDGKYKPKKTLGNIFTYFRDESNKSIYAYIFLYLEYIRKFRIKRKFNAIQEDVKIGISIGVSGYILPAPGFYNGVYYNKIIKDIYPDHLAILFEEKPACEIDEGCGIKKFKNNNEKNEKKEEAQEMINFNSQEKQKGESFPLDSESEKNVFKIIFDQVNQNEEQNNKKLDDRFSKIEASIENLSKTIEKKLNDTEKKEIENKEEPKKDSDSEDSKKESNNESDKTKNANTKKVVNNFTGQAGSISSCSSNSYQKPNYNRGYFDLLANKKKEE